VEMSDQSDGTTYRSSLLSYQHIISLLGTINGVPVRYNIPGTTIPIIHMYSGTSTTTIIENLP
jgi:hypothetical protein